RLPCYRRTVAFEPIKSYPIPFAYKQLSNSKADSACTSCYDSGFFHAHSLVTGKAKLKIDPAGFSSVPETEMATNCLPSAQYVHGVAFATPGKSISHSICPLRFEYALNFLSRVPPIKTKP